jgi:catechol 2,3-dioxygenase
MKGPDVAHISHVELLTPKAPESLEFFTNVLGMEVEATEGGSVYLRGWGDYQRWTLKLTESHTSGMNEMALRAWDDEALERRVAEIEKTGLGDGWIDGDVGHGRAYRFRDPDGHQLEIYYETEWYVAEGDQVSYLPNQPQAFDGHGAGARRLDHLNLFCADVPANSAFYADVLGFRLFEQIVVDDVQKAAWMSVTAQPHDMALTKDATGSRGRFHHLAFWVDNREDVLRAAELFTERGAFIECGPAKHSRTQGFYLYVYEPGGNRVEVFSGGFPVYAPDWPVVTWSQKTLSRGTAWGATVPDSFHVYGTPPRPVASH